MKILLPMDESEYSIAALQAVLKQIVREDTQIRVLHVVEPITAYVPAGPIPVPEFTDTSLIIEQERRKTGTILVAEVAETLRTAGFQASHTVDSGDAKSVIIEHAENWDADLIVLGSHGLKGLSRFLMGSVSDAVMRHAHCSVQVVRRKTKELETDADEAEVADLLPVAEELGGGNGNTVVADREPGTKKPPLIDNTDE